MAKILKRNHAANRLNSMSLNPQTLKQALDLARNTDVRSPEFLATRVLAHFESDKTASRLKTWKWISAGLFASLALVVYTVSFRDSSFTAPMWQPQVVKVELEKFKVGDQIEVEVILPEGIEFYSSTMPELRELRTLRFAVDAEQMKEGKLIAPFVILGKDSGHRKVKVNFYNQNQEVVMQKQVNIQFLGAEGT